MEATYKDAPANNGKYALVNGIKMYYEIAGNGHPLVLIHGGGSTIRTSFGYILPLLATTYTTIAVELQGHGHTTDRDVSSTFEQDADDVAELLQQLNISDAYVFGFSNGGNTAMQIAIRHPRLASKLVLASSFFKRDGMYSWFWEGMKNASLNSMPKIYQDEFLSINNSQEALQAMHDKDAGRMQAFVDWKAESLQLIKAPALIVIGGQDVVTPEHAVEMHRLLINSRLAILPGTHGSYMGEIMSLPMDSKIPGLFVAIVNEFFAAQIPE